MIASPPAQVAIGSKYPVAFERLLGHEGGVSRDTSDPASKAVAAGQAHTNLGITLATVRAFDKDGHLPDWLRVKLDVDHDGALTALDVPGWTRETAYDFFLAFYWKAANCDLFPWPISNLVFDLAVNAGKARAIITLQKTLGVTPDGVAGPETVRAARNANVDRLLMDFTAHKLDFYRQNPPESVAANFLGWARRSVDQLIFCMQEAA